MKRCKWIIYLVICFMGINVYFYNEAVKKAYAETNTNIDELAPNDYEGKSTDKNTDLLDEDASSSSKSEIPEEQKQLIFDGKKTFSADDVKEKLFQKAATNKIEQNAEQLGLFAGDDEIRQAGVSEETLPDTTSSLSLFLGILIAVCITLLGIVLTVFYRTAKQGERKGQ
ncbi:type VII secretion protein EssA [Bacillus sp. Au-Bac7]|uniref:type VII secretion protein EssA n=2 Tax=Bacillaceae TaxID=186817 RepID=UPI001E3EC55D|nr:type VII secretion protein EssA [Bacillus sp. Au-Bac7]MCE4049772.1 type VII secretion protein EssA [Bacillus sp. Au-Bac7]